MRSKVLAVLESLDVLCYRPEGCEFDPHLHEAFASVHDPNLGNNVITDVIRRGYIYEGRVLRPSLVKVANPR